MIANDLEQMSDAEEAETVVRLLRSARPPQERQKVFSPENVAGWLVVATDGKKTQNACYYNSPDAEAKGHDEEELVLRSLINCLPWACELAGVDYVHVLNVLLSEYEGGKIKWMKN